MNNETFNNQTNSLFNINKTNEISDDINNINITSYNDNKSKKFDLLRSKTIKNFNLQFGANKDKDKDKDIDKEKDNDKDNSLFRKSYKSNKILIDNENTKNPLDKGLNDEETYTNIKNDLINTKKPNTNMKPFNFKNYYKSHTLRFIDFPKKGHQNKKLTLHKKVKNNNNDISEINDINDNDNDNNDKSDIIKEVEKSNCKDKLFSTEIEFDFSIEDNPNVLFTNKNINNYYKYKNESIPNLSLDKYIKQDKYKQYEDPLLIPKEDMIFDEIKKYKCFKYFTQESLNKTGVPFIYIQMNMNPNNSNVGCTNNNNKNKDKSLSNNKYLQKLLKTGKDKIFLDRRYNKDINEERRKEILSNIYRIPTSPDFYKRIEVMKAKKDKKKLKNYQNNFLKIVKHNISNKYYESLKDKFLEIRNAAEGKYHTNFKFLKEIEKNEENVINNINELCKKYKKYLAKKKVNKLFVIGPRLKLPKIKFIQLAKKDLFSEDEKNIKNKKNHMNKTSVKFNKDKNNLGITQNSSKTNLFSSTNYNKFNLKSQSCKKYNK